MTGWREDGTSALLTARSGVLIAGYGAHTPLRDHYKHAPKDYICMLSVGMCTCARAYVYAYMYLSDCELLDGMNCELVDR